MIEKMNEGGANAMNQDQEGRYLEFRGLSSEILSDHYNGQEFKDILFRKDSFAIRLIRDQATELIDQETNRHNRDEFLDKIKALSKTIKLSLYLLNTFSLRNSTNLSFIPPCSYNFQPTHFELLTAHNRVNFL